MCAASGVLAQPPPPSKSSHVPLHLSTSLASRRVVAEREEGGNGPTEHVFLKVDKKTKMVQSRKLDQGRTFIERRSMCNRQRLGLLQRAAVLLAPAVLLALPVALSCATCKVLPATRALNSAVRCCSPEYLRGHSPLTAGRWWCGRNARIPFPMSFAPQTVWCLLAMGRFLSGNRLGFVVAGINASARTATPPAERASC